MLRTASAVAAALSVGIAAAASARPVSYQGGWTAIEETDRQSTALWVHYTPRPVLSIGARSEWDRRRDVVFNGVQATYLVNRWFGQNYQGNLYAFAGAGVASGVDDNPLGSRGAGFVGALADWETRRWFLSYRARAFEAGDLDASFVHAGRVGVAPYIGDTGDLHTWLMLEIDHRPDAERPVDVTPLARFFRGPALLELGWSLADERPLANFAYRF